MSMPSSSVVVELRMFLTPALNRSCNLRFSLGSSWALCSSAHRPILKMGDSRNSRRRRPSLGSLSKMAAITGSNVPSHPTSGAQPATLLGHTWPVVRHRKRVAGRRRPSPKKSSLIASTELFPCAWRLSVLSQGRFRPRAASSNWLKQARRRSLAAVSVWGSAIPQLLSTAAPNLSLLCRLVAPMKRTNRADRSALSADAQRPTSILPNVYSLRFPTPRMPVD